MSTTVSLCFRVGLQTLHPHHGHGDNPNAPEGLGGADSAKKAAQPLPRVTIGEGPAQGDQMEQEGVSSMQ